MVSLGQKPVKQKVKTPSRSQSGIVDRVKSHAALHLVEAKLSARRLREAGSSSILTALVIAIALALPTGLFLVLDNVQALVSNWGGQTNVTLFVREGISDKRAQALSRELDAWEVVQNTRFIGQEEALREFKKSSGLEDVLASLEANPLPAAIVIKPYKHSIEALQLLEQRLSKLSETESVVIDTQWIGRLNAMLSLGQRFIFALGLALGGAVLLVVFNTIRLGIANRQDEILITKLVGATDAFVRRPFLYTGMWYGFAGGIFALVLVEVLVILLQGPVSNLATLYQSDYALQGVSVAELFMVPLVSILVSLTGAWFAVSNHLRGMEPSV